MLHRNERGRKRLGLAAAHRRGCLFTLYAVRGNCICIAPALGDRNPGATRDGDLVRVKTQKFKI